MNKQLIYKLITLGILALVLAYAVGQVESKVREREAARDSAVQSIADQYAGGQQLAGPLLWVKCHEPVAITETDDKGKTRKRTEIRDCSGVVRPTEIKIDGNMEVNERYRGIYKARVYLTALKLKASIPPYQPKAGQTVERADLVFGVTDPRGLKLITVSSEGKDLAAAPGVPGGLRDSGFHVPVDLGRLAGGMSLEANLELAGSGRLDFAPLGRNNDFSLSSSWPHPSFSGDFLPEKREIDGAGFAARWRVNDFATGGNRVLEGLQAKGDLPTTLGVRLVDPVDSYTQTDRAVRYGFLFVLLTLGGFFLFELLKNKSVHPLQYLLIGFAVVIFFLLLLALSEHLAFSLAYLAAAGACVLLIAAYGRTLLGSWKGAAGLGAGYALLYFGLYQLLASEDYALLMGAWLIFGLLALTMYLTRRLDWNKIGRTVLPEARAEKAE